mmetsp:Transcript_24946/g.47820  ORF Transcript_24946/g.47820 Transcript_24946/m.47820 type:complete len:257 (+) Transcript_24946:1583-2353(+)
MVQDTGRVDDLPPQIFVVRVTYEETLGGEGIRLDIHVGACDFVHEGTLTHIRQSAHEQRPRIRIQRRQSAHVLPDFLQVTQTRLLPLQNGAHPTQRRPLETLASVQAVAVLDHADHVAGDAVAELLGRVDLTEGELVVISVVEGVAEVGVEGVDVGEAREVGEHGRESVRDCLLGEFDFAHVKVTNSRNLVTGMNHRRSSSLRSRQHDIHEIVCARHRGHLLEVVYRHDYLRNCISDDDDDVSRGLFGVALGRLVV